MRYLLLVVYLFSTASFAGHCSAGASHDRDHDKEAKQSEMKEESTMKKDSEVEINEAEAKEDKDTEA
ncbi:MAG: hypothetical protein ACJ0QX_06510 [Gammaproteobacteria bacterium]